ncbi:hypothetical protein CRX72_29320 [Pantoea sp. BRM17]|nr:hypothetical protein CRX72_29320 [Pantoea sp. BRM17]
MYKKGGTISEAHLFNQSAFIRLAKEVAGAREKMGHYGMALTALPDGRLALLALERNWLMLNGGSAGELQDYQLQGSQPVSDSAFSLAINAQYGRSQNQLHIHLSCLRPEVRQQLDSQASHLHDAWQPVTINRHRYLVRLAQHSKPAPCKEVNLRQGHVIYKDIKGPHHYLLMPIEKISGMESPVLLDPYTPNFLAAAWQHRDLLSRCVTD